ncbi:RNA polymerase sigma factor [Acinetobacter qingfengensis]|uniref:Uncharacterized protein n=1 Tax=Acinetobacter qingfengensis TaxID=1262585 RepID=A0A1E7R1Q2_9GAMM|nr:RNA polymerase sigma factor [Acinetobacter qingfengensis]KAA8730841.1 RNA polymerase sigma factor [Acinetobacter qingfengensis]OEY93235.1 hypothetical protein BJI46_14455 [Acinetobacter qingfengensis]
MKQRQNQLVEFFVNHHDELLNYLSARLGNRQFAMEMVQETYLQMARKSDYFENKVMTLALLKRVSLNLAIDHCRKQQTLEDRIDFDSEKLNEFSDLELHGWTSAELVVAQQQFEKMIFKKIHELPPVCQDVFILAHVHHLTREEIAKQLELSLSMVTKHLNRAYPCLIPLLFPTDHQD